MSNYDNEYDKTRAHLDELVRKHRELDEFIIKEFSTSSSSEARRYKTQKLWLKDEIHRLETYLKNQ